MATSESEKWREEAKCYRRLYGKYRALFSEVSREEKIKAVERLRNRLCLQDLADVRRASQGA